MISYQTSAKDIKTNIYLLKNAESARKDSSPRPELKLENITPTHNKVTLLFQRKKTK